MDLKLFILSVFIHQIRLMPDKALIIINYMSPLALF